MFPDSDIAKSYRQSSTKIAYVIQHGIASYLFDSIIANIKDKPFSFMFDETTTSQVKKQFDGYVRFWSNNQVETSYCGSLFMGHCSADQMVDHFLDFKKRLNWDNSLMLHLGMDGPNLNKSFQKKLSKKLEENNNQFLNIGSCNLHKVHNAFRKGLSELNIDLDQFACNIYFFFKLSSALREDYRDLEKIIEVAAAYAIKRSSTRWLSLKFVYIRILEQWNNSKQYFLAFLPKQKNFVREIKETARYKRTVQNLKSNLTLPYLAFVVFIAHSFDNFLVLFQSSEPLIHTLYERMKDLLTKIMSYFIKKKFFS